MSFLKKVFFQDKFCFRLLFLWIIILSVLYSSLSVLRHIHFQSGAFDLGLYDQAVWQYAHFLSPFNTIKERFILGDHLSLTLPLLSPLFWIWDDVKLLLIFQAVFITFSAIPIYLLAKLRKFSPLVSLCISFIYSLFFGIQFAVYFDFHPIVLGVALLAWFIYFFEAKKKRLFFITLFLILLTQEDMGFALAGLGFIYFFRKDYRKFAILFIILGISISLIETKIIGFLSPIGFEYTPHISHNPLQVIKELFDNPQKIQTWIYSLGWFSFLPVFSLGSIVAVVANLAQFFVTGPEFSRMWSPFMHHRAILAVFLSLGTLETLSFIKKVTKKSLYLNLIVLLLLISALSQQFVFHFPLNKLSKSIYWRSESWMNDNNKILSQLPVNASVATAQNLVPHLSHRKEIYLVYPRIKDSICKGCWWLDFAGKPQYLAIDLHSKQWTTQLLESNENFQSAVKNMEEKGKITKFRNINDTYIFKINY